MSQEGRALGGPLRAAFATGSVALLAAMAIDFMSVVGRHLGHPFPGSIELVQVSVVVAAAAAVIGATLSGAHAAVHVITERLPEGQRRLWARLAAILGALFFAMLTVGGVWLIADTLGGDERTDLLGLPLLPFRAIWCAATALAAVLFVRDAIWPRLPPARGEVPLEP
jgi:TRAP-type C4-dicarboxylate transport system permease small subunit